VTFPVTWQKARVLAGNPALPAGTELWVMVGPATLVTPAGEGIVETHAVLARGVSLYARLSQIELVAEFCQTVPRVPVEQLAGFSPAGVLAGMATRCN